MDAPIGVGIIGLGFMGQTHLNGYRHAADHGQACRVVALCDNSIKRIEEALASLSAESRKHLAPNPACCSDLEAFLSTPKLRVVNICTYTDTHVELAMRALSAGKHVLLEKPVALRAADVARVQDAAAASGLVCMPAMCMRFWPGWTWLKERVVDRRYGALKAAHFSRLGSAPQWTPFYADFNRSGGALFDLHIHDADFVRWLLGDPRSVTATGRVTHLTTIYHFEKDVQVVAEGGWLASGFPFRMRYVANFESATADFDSGRSASLLLTHSNVTVPVPLEPWSGWDAEIVHMLELLSGATNVPRVTMQDALAVTRLLECESASLQSGGAVAIH